MNLLALLPSPYTEIAVAGGVVASAATGYWRGSQAEHYRHVVREAKAAAQIAADTKRMQDAFNTVSGRLAVQQQDQAQTFTEIRNVAGPIVYRNRNVCLSGDDAGLLDRARAAADGGDPAEPAGGAEAPAAVPTGR